MIIRKLINFPNNNHKNLLDENKKIIWEKCESIAHLENDEQLEYKKHHDDLCPNCRNKDKDKIVNRFAFVQGKRRIKSNIRFGFGNIDGTINIETCEVNHCNVCGNEWLKFKTKNINAKEILIVSLKYLGQILKNPEEKKNDWKLEAIKVFDNCCAEIIHKLSKEYDDYLPESVSEQLTLKKLRQHYKSVYDSTKIRKI